jgi:glycine/D-amino acid oxidase-like deaminating enzyme
VALCQTCADITRKSVTDAMLAKGLSGVFIAHELTKLGLKTTDNMVNSHRKHYLPPVDQDAAKREKDLAILVRDRTYDAIVAGRLEPNVRDGITAQGLLDRREEKVDDRNTALALARLLSGRGDPNIELLAPDHVVVIDGVYQEVEEEAMADA